MSSWGGTFKVIGECTSMLFPHLLWKLLWAWSMAWVLSMVLIKIVTVQQDVFPRSLFMDGRFWGELFLSRITQEMNKLEPNGNNLKKKKPSVRSFDINHWPCLFSSFLKPKITLCISYVDIVLLFLYFRGRCGNYVRKGLIKSNFLHFKPAFSSFNLCHDSFLTMFRAFHNAAH